MRTDNNMILAVISREKWTQQTDRVNPRYPPSRFAIFRYSDSQILIRKIRFPPQISLLRHRIRQIFISRASQNSFSCLSTYSLPPTFTHHRRTITQFPLPSSSSSTSRFPSSLLRSLSTITIFCPFSAC